MNKAFGAVARFFTDLPVMVYAAIAALVLLAGTVWYCNSQVEERVEQAEEKGQLQERAVQMEQTITNIKKAEEAREEINTPGPVGDRARYDQCLRTARTPANCERFLPDIQADQR